MSNLLAKQVIEVEDRATKNLDKIQDGFKKLGKETDNLGKVGAKFGKIDDSIKNSIKSLVKFDLLAKKVIEIEDRATKNLDKIQDGFKKLGKETDNLGKVGAKFGKIDDSIKNSTKSLVQFGIAFVSTKNMFLYLVDRSKNLAKMQNNLHATTEQMTLLGDTISNVSKKGVADLQDIYHGSLELSRVLSFDELKESLQDVNNLASTIGKSFSQSAVIYKGAFKIFKKEGLSTAEIADRMGFAYDKFGLDIDDFEMFFQSAGKAIVATNQKMETSIAILETFKDELQTGGAIAGTTFRTISSALANQNKMKKFSQITKVPMQDLNIQNNDFIDILEKMKKGLDGLSETKAMRLLQESFGENALTVKGLIKLLDELKSRKIDKSYIDFTKKGAENRLNTLEGAWEQLKISVNSAGDAFKDVEPELITILKTVTQLIEGVKTLASWIVKIVGGFGRFTEKFSATNIIKQDLNDYETKLSDRKKKNNENINQLLASKPIQNLFLKQNLQNNNMPQSNIIEKMTPVDFTKNLNNNIKINLEIDSRDKNLNFKTKSITTSGSEKINNANISVNKKDYTNF